MQNLPKCKLAKQKKIALATFQPIYQIANAK